jgi:integrase/recombinase XerC
MTHIDTWPAALEQFERALTGSHRAPATTAAYMLHVKWLSEATPDGPWSPTPREISTWLTGHGWSLHTKRKTLVSLRAFYAWAISNGHTGRSPLVGVAAATAKPTGPARTSPTAQWDSPIHDFLNGLHAAGLSHGTMRQREVWLVNLSHCFANPWSVTAQDLADYLSRPDWSAEYKRSGRSSIRRFYRWAMRAGHIEINPADDLDPVRVTRALPRPTPTAAILDAYEVADRETRLAMDFALYAGLRIGEVARLTFADVRGDRILVNGKGGKQRVVPLHRELRDAVGGERSRRAELRDESPWIFPSRDGKHLTAGCLGKRVSDALGPGWSAHTLRHRFATAAYQATTDLRAVQELLGHAKPETTAIYAAAADDSLIAAVSAVSLR